MNTTVNSLQIHRQIKIIYMQVMFSINNNIKMLLDAYIIGKITASFQLNYVQSFLLLDLLSTCI